MAKKKGKAKGKGKKQQSELQKMAAAFNDAGIKGMEDIDLEQEEDDLKEDFMSTIEEAEEKGKLKKVPKAAIKYYEQLVEEEEEDEPEPEEEEETETEEDDDDEDEEEDEDLEEMTLKQLKVLAKEKGVTAKQLKGKKKKAVIKLIEDAADDEEEDDDEEEEDEGPDLEEMTLKELKAHAKSLGVKAKQLKGKKSKAVIKMIEAIQETEDDDEDEEEEKPKGKKGKKPSFKRGKDGYTREQSVCDVLKKSKKAIDPSQLGEMANDLYTDKDGSDNVKQSNTIATRALRYFRGIGIIKEVKGGKVKLDL